MDRTERDREGDQETDKYRQTETSERHRERERGGYDWKWNSLFLRGTTFESSTCDYSDDLQILLESGEQETEQRSREHFDMQPIVSWM